MALTPEWRNRIDLWRNELTRHFYEPIQSVDWVGFQVQEQLTLAQARSRTCESYPPGTAWGPKWGYAWFLGSVTLPDNALGQRVVLCADVGGESAVYINGAAAGAIDRQHHEITLSTDGQPGATYDVAVEAYAGHGVRQSHAGPTPLGRETVPEPPEQQCVMGESSLGIWHEDVYQLWLDVQVLYEIRENTDAESLRVAEIDEALRQFTMTVDFEAGEDLLHDTVAQARERLAPLMAAHNGSTAPTMYTIGHSHIDVAWLWPLGETERKCTRTFGTQLALMEEYNEYQFLQSQPHLYRFVQRNDPELYARIVEAAKRGQWIPEGGMWVEADTNLSGGESLIRQFLHGKRFFQDEFGVDCQMLWLPDVFGYSGNMPQIMRGCGVRYFATAKIFWAYNGGDPYPYNTFMWEGIDGSEVLVHLCNDYNSHTNPAAVIERWTQRVQKDGIAERLMPFGYGDGGGGPTRDHLEFLSREADLEGVPRTRMAHPLEFFRDIEARGPVTRRYVGELYFQAHRGTYTSQAKTKLGNRKSELALREAELWSSAAGVLVGFAHPAAELDEAWKAVLLNQFHDIIPGSSIHRVYEEAEASYAKVLVTADTIRQDAQRALAPVVNDDDALTVFNSLSWLRKAAVELPEGWLGAQDASGMLDVQLSEDGALAEVALPAMGWASLSESACRPCENTLVATPTLLENAYLRATLDEKGQITSLWDKEAGRELAAGPLNALRMYRDVTTKFDAWDIDSMTTDLPVELDAPACVSVISSGPLEARLLITRQLHQSSLSQEIVLRRDSRRLDFETTIDWRERHKLLKVDFPVNVHAREALHDIQFGHVARPNHRSRPFDADRFEVCNHKWTALAEAERGAAVLNDCKYGVSTLGNTISLTLLKSALAPDMTADQGMQGFTYSLFTWNGPMASSGLVQQAYDLNCPVTTVAGDAGTRSLMQVDAANVIIETAKPAEDGSGDLIVRLYESAGTATDCSLHVDLPVASAAITNMLEVEPVPLDLADGTVALSLTPFQVVTLRYSFV